MKNYKIAYRNCETGGVLRIGVTTTSLEEARIFANEFKNGLKEDYLVYMVE